MIMAQVGCLVVCFGWDGVSSHLFDSFHDSFHVSYLL